VIAESGRNLAACMVRNKTLVSAIVCRCNITFVPAYKMHSQSKLAWVMACRKVNHSTVSFPFGALSC